MALLRKNNAGNRKTYWVVGAVFVAVFLFWTLLVLTVDVQPLGQNGTDLGLAALNTRFHDLTGVHLTLYTVTDRLELVPFAVCAGFGALGLWQLIRQKSLRRVDRDILVLGGYYILVIACFFFFEMIPVNYRPVLIEGRMEASYPSSTTLLVLSVMPTLCEQLYRRLRNRTAKRWIFTVTALFSVFMVIGRLLSGVHWLTDIFGSVLLSTGLFLLYQAAVQTLLSREK